MGRIVTDHIAETWITVTQATKILEVDERTVRRWANDDKLNSCRNESDRRAPILILLSSLPEAAQKKYRAEQEGALVVAAHTQIVPLVQKLPATTAGEPDERYRTRWDWYEMSALIEY